MDAVYGQFTDCDILRNRTRTQQPHSMTAHRAILRHPPTSVVDKEVVCTFNRGADYCKNASLTATNGQRQRVVNDTLNRAQQHTVRSVEVAVNRSAQNRRRYDDAACLKVQQQVL